MKQRYADAVELYRRQLWRAALRQGNRMHPMDSRRAKSNFLDKLMRYARQAGVNHLNVLAGEPSENDLLIGWAGQRLKDKMRAMGRVHLGKKIPKVSRRIQRNDFQYSMMFDRILSLRCIPVVEVPELKIAKLEQITTIFNHKQGELRLLVAGQEIVIPFKSTKDKTVDEVVEAWAAVKVARVSDPSEFRPLFRQRNRLRQ